jgi:hypothetical protein
VERYGKDQGKGPGSKKNLTQSRKGAKVKRRARGMIVSAWRFSGVLLGVRPLGYGESRLRC